MYKYIYEYVYVYIWEYANPCKLTFAWLVFSLGFIFVYVQEVEKYLCSKKMKSGHSHCKTLYCTVEGFNAQQTVLMHNRKLYCIAGSFIAQQKVLLHSRRFYCSAKSFAA